MKSSQEHAQEAVETVKYPITCIQVTNIKGSVLESHLKQRLKFSPS